MRSSQIGLPFPKKEKPLTATGMFVLLRSGGGGMKAHEFHSWLRQRETAVMDKYRDLGYTEGYSYGWAARSRAPRAA